MTAGPVSGVSGGARRVGLLCGWNSTAGLSPSPATAPAPCRGPEVIPVSALHSHADTGSALLESQEDVGR